MLAGLFSSIALIPKILLCLEARVFLMSNFLSTAVTTTSPVSLSIHLATA